MPHVIRCSFKSHIFIAKYNVTEGFRDLNLFTSVGAE